MSNSISLGGFSFGMSNGLTDVFIDCMLLAGSELADTESQRRLIAFLSEKQQSVTGMGTAGFDITEMPWDRDSFEADMSFLRDTVSRARELSSEESTRELLGYTPEKEHITYALNSFAELSDRMTAADIRENTLSEWLSDRSPDDPVLHGCTKCPQHRLIMSFHGCKLCRDLQ